MLQRNQVTGRPVGSFKCHAFELRNCTVRRTLKTDTPPPEEKPLVDGPPNDKAGRRQKNPVIGRVPGRVTSFDETCLVSLVLTSMHD